jgi:hypothetical protein
MGKKMSEKDLEIYKKIDEILYFDWNPIGIDELPRDEYQSYTPKIFTLKKSEANNETIAQTLCELELYILGNPGDIVRCREISKKIEAI